ncbi:trihelix transcription factor GTL1-like isoform X2 [Salvia splendens]|uniref:trihelix transcription factor GTL1-like isoform X2 n=1 Tax=Salvia splendens TaxID=180675 RepID=UPI001C274968|nr:trihelix transcription factor GTL1-like isoform X2 [Salvia splendens]
MQQQEEEEVAVSDEKLGDLGIAEAASPISSRPPAANFEGGSSSNRWPRQETLALLQIRCQMDAAFRDATLKAPLWEQVCRKLGEVGYKRSAKKCKEKFENVYKYYKRTKEGRGGRQDGKTYKFFSQLEALDQTTANPAAAAVSLAPPPPALFSLTFSSDSSSDDEETETGKRKRSGDSDERMMEFFEGVLRQVMQKQEAMQQRFLVAIEKREQDRMIRDEAWKRQGMARVAREHEIAAQERAITASRDAAIVDFLEKITGQTIQLPAAPVPPPLPPQPATVEMPVQDLATSEPSSSRWPKPEVLALIKLRSSMEPRYQEAGPKGPLWDEISARMQSIGYNRSAKRCKEKWENINKYFKKVKESNKKRPQDAKTCPYFDELDALYRNKILNVPPSTSLSHQPDLQHPPDFPSNPFVENPQPNLDGENQKTL